MRLSALTLTHTHSHSLTHTRIHALTHTLTLSHSHSHTLAFAAHCVACLGEEKGKAREAIPQRTFYKKDPLHSRREQSPQTVTYKVSSGASSNLYQPRPPTATSVNRCVLHKNPGLWHAWAKRRSSCAIRLLRRGARPHVPSPSCNQALIKCTMFAPRRNLCLLSVAIILALKTSPVCPPCDDASST